MRIGRRTKVAVTGGKKCPKCPRKMQRFEHHPDWIPSDRVKLWYEYWDYCKPCRHVQLYADAKYRPNWMEEEFGITPQMIEDDDIPGHR